MGGEVLLRIEDIDTTRCRPEYTAAIYEDLAWLGFEWPEPVRVQSQHFDAYEQTVLALTERELTYRCFRTRSELATLSNPTVPGSHDAADEAERLAKGEAFAWRLSLDACRETLGSVWQDLSYQVLSEQGVESVPARPEIEGDAVIARKDSPSAYHLAATHDDALQGITHLIRGEDLIDAPHIQTLLQVLMSWSQPVYQHHALILGEDGAKLSKRDKSLTLAELRADGVTPDQIKQRLGFA